MYDLRLEITAPFQINLYGLCMLIMSKHVSLDRNKLKSFYYGFTDEYFQTLKNTYMGLLDSGVLGMEIFRLEREGVYEYNFKFKNKEKAMFFKLRGLVNEPERIL